jgi:hypothetical protein
LFKDIGNNEILTVNGVSQFRAFTKNHNIVQFTPYNPNRDVNANDESLFIYDLDLGDFIRDNKNIPLQTKKSLQVVCVRKNDERVLLFKDVNENALYYINGQGRFYHDNINGFIFKHNYWHDGYAYYPGRFRGGWGQLRDGDAYELPENEEMSANSAPLPAKFNCPLSLEQSVMAESKTIDRRLHNIIIETIIRELNIPL